MPFIYGGGVFPIDMATGLLRYAAAGRDAGDIGLTDMAHYYRLPMFSFAAAPTPAIYDRAGRDRGRAVDLLSSLNAGNLVPRRRLHQ